LSALLELLSGSSHVLPLQVLADDVIAYILVKSGCHVALFDKESPCLYEFLVEMEHAHELSNDEKWKAANEMRRGNSNPRYPGLAGGRLVGHVKKMPTEITNELMFSLKV
jgi:hypothetical protein